MSVVFRRLARVRVYFAWGFTCPHTKCVDKWKCLRIVTRETMNYLRVLRHWVLVFMANSEVRPFVCVVLCKDSEGECANCLLESTPSVANPHQDPLWSCACKSGCPGGYLSTEEHDQLKIRPYFLPWVSKNRRYRILNGIDRIGHFLRKLLNLEACNLVGVYKIENK